MMNIEIKRYQEINYVQKSPEICKGKNPAIILLHGAGSRGTDVHILKNLRIFSKNCLLNEESSPFIVFVPQCHRNTWFDMFEQLQSFVHMVKEHPSVDPDRLYLMGTSMGGFGAWQLAMTMPNAFAAVVPICGGGMKWNAKRITQIPIWAFHGKEDTTVPPEESVLMVEAVNKAGGNARLTLLDGVGHNSWEFVYEHRELFDWLLAQQSTSRCLEEDCEYCDSVRFG